MFRLFRWGTITQYLIPYKVLKDGNHCFICAELLKGGCILCGVVTNPEDFEVQSRQCKSCINSFLPGKRYSAENPAGPGIDAVKDKSSSVDAATDSSISVEQAVEHGIDIVKDQSASVDAATDSSVSVEQAVEHGIFIDAAKDSSVSVEQAVEHGIFIDVAKDQSTTTIENINKAIETCGAQRLAHQDLVPRFMEYTNSDIGTW